MTATSLGWYSYDLNKVVYTCHQHNVFVRVCETACVVFYPQMSAISRNIPFYLPEITQLLDNVPRQLLLILKTNDLLRGLEYSLGSSQHKQSYITMSKYCVKAIGSFEVNKTTNGWVERWKWRARTSFLLVMLQFYQAWLWFKAVLLP